jgi:hypothetical protein
MPPFQLQSFINNIASQFIEQMKDPRRFYTYAYLREDGTPYYIGKGTNRRAYKRTHNVFLPPKERILFLKKNLLEEEAYQHEIYMIAVLGRKDLGTGILRNKTDGGDGAKGMLLTEDYLKKLKERTTGKNHPLYGKKHSEKTKKLQSKVKLGKNNPFYGKKHSQEWIDNRIKLNCIFEYKITSPSGEIFYTRNLAEFCRKHNLNNGAMCLVANEKTKSYKKWNVEKYYVGNMLDKPIQ